MSFRSARLLPIVLSGIAITAFGQTPDAAVPAPRPAGELPAVLELSGPIDGSERIEVTQSGAIWHNVDRLLPSAPMAVNGVKWNPRHQPALANRGDTAFLADVDYSLARLEVIEGRDTVAMTKSDDGIMLHLNDTPNGEGQYRFRVVFTPEDRPADLRIRATIDGSDVLHITPSEARWEHKHWNAPTAVTLNGVAWNPTTQPVLSNEGESEFLSASVDFSTARIIHKSGRDMAVVVPEENGLVVYFADNPNGAEDYELLIAFGK